ncbi:putative mitochondrial protein [Apostasia shenzhenica]|uniref:Putative mitochondrial protein n=1 Tax=Apostasia shenzhenica TaxID=1088818 RepID=A0A2I0APK1_9ASPA|nr:putative mitochondrial protein [Apostasia shenzhenica]
MGFWNIKETNEDMVAKQGWQILNSQNSLLACADTNASYIWRSILWGRELLQKGTRWRIGNGKKMKIFKDQWLPKVHSSKSITRPPQEQEELTVAERMDTNGEWNWARIQNTLWPIAHDTIKMIKAAFNEKEGILIKKENTQNFLIKLI